MSVILVVTSFEIHWASTWRGDTVESLLRLCIQVSRGVILDDSSSIMSLISLIDIDWNFSISHRVGECERKSNVLETHVSDEFEQYNDGVTILLIRIIVQCP